MALLPIVEVPDPRLRQISSPVETVDDEVRALVADMFETMYAAPGIGLAAIQVGVPWRILVIDLQEPADPEDPESKPVKDPRVFINPEIVEHSDQDVPYTEGCLSVPDQYAEVDRPDRIPCLDPARRVSAAVPVQHLRRIRAVVQREVFGDRGDAHGARGSVHFAHLEGAEFERPGGVDFALPVDRLRIAEIAPRAMRGEGRIAGGGGGGLGAVGSEESEREGEGGGGDRAELGGVVARWGEEHA